MVQCYLAVNRVDLAQKLVERMASKDDDATLTQLATAWVNLAVGGEKIQDAFFIFQELGEKYSETVMLLNGKAICLMQQHKFDEAEKVLMASLQRQPSHAETLMNLVVCNEHQGKAPDAIARNRSQLVSVAGEHEWTRKYNAAVANFDRLAAASAM